MEEGYFLIDDVMSYIQDDSDWDIFYDKMTVVEYAERFRNELVFGVPEPKKDREGEIIESHSCRDYMYFRYEKHLGVDAEVKRINEIFALLTDDCPSENLDYVVVCDIS